MIDLDGFKPINDTLGHEAGDALLVELSHRLRDALRVPDLVARLGGDEFVVLMPGLTQPADATLIADPMVKLLRAPLEPRAFAERGLGVTASIGCIFKVAGEQQLSFRILLKEADELMYEAKSRGGNQWVASGGTGSAGPSEGVVGIRPE